MASPSWTSESSLAIFLLIVTSTFFLPDELQQVAELYALSLNHLPNSNGRVHFAGHIPLAVGSLELSHQ